MKILCFDIGCTDIKYGIIEDGNILIKKKIPTNVPAGLENFKENLKIIVDCLTATTDIKYVGVSCAGSIDINQSKIIVSPDNALWLGDFDFKAFFINHSNTLLLAHILSSYFIALSFCNFF